MKKYIISTSIIIVFIITVILVANNNDKKIPVIGGLFNITGYASFAGESSKNGFLMAIEDSKLDNKEIKTVIEDAQSDLKSAVSGATKLTQIDKAIVVIGPEWTEFGEVVAPIANKSMVPFISPWIVAEAPFVKPPYFWSAFPSDRSEHVALVNYLAGSKYKKISLVYSNNFWSLINIKMLKEEVEKKDSLKFVSEYNLDQSTKDFRTIIAKIKADNPDIIYAAIGDDKSYGVFVSQVRQLGINIPISANSARAGSPIMKEKYPNLLYKQIFAETVVSPKLKKFEDKYEKRFVKKPEAPSAVVAYDTTMIIVEALKSGAKTSEEIIKHLENMQPYDGYSGTIAFDKNGQLPIRKAVVKMYNDEGVAVEIN